jgi:hypothetical protein
MKEMKKSFKPGDLVSRSYGEGQRPAALFIGFYKQGTRSELAEVIWLGDNHIEQIGPRYLEHLEVISESR